MQKYIYFVELQCFCRSMFPFFLLKIFFGIHNFYEFGDTKHAFLIWKESPGLRPPPLRLPEATPLLLIQHPGMDALAKGCGH